MERLKSGIAAGVCLLLAWPSRVAAMSEAEFGQNVRVYLYRTGVFADQYLGVGLPSSDVLQSKLWYIRPEESARALFGMDQMADFLQGQSVPGLDFTGDRTLAASDVERLFQQPGSSIRILKLAGTLVGDDALPALGKLYDLRVLELGRRVTDRGVLKLGDLQNLKVLSVAGPGISNKSASVLAGLKNLERLSIRDTTISDDSLADLAKLPLRQFDAGPKITDQGLRVLSSVKTLQQLDLSQAQVTQAGLSDLAAAPSIHTLFLGASLSDKDLEPLLRFKNLKRLDLTGAHVTDKGADVLAQMNQLEELALTKTQVSGAALEKLKNLPHLRYLEISETHINPQDFKKVQGFGALQVLSLSSTKRLALDDIKPLGRWPRLHSILINGVMLGPDMVDTLRRSQETRLWTPWIAVADAADTSDADVEHALVIASAVTQETSHAFQGFQGLKRIHEAEASLEDVAAATERPKIVTFEENEKNFMGEITVGAVSSKHKTAPQIKRSHSDE